MKHLMILTTSVFLICSATYTYAEELPRTKVFYPYHIECPECGKASFASEGIVYSGWIWTEDQKDFDLSRRIDITQNLLVRCEHGVILEQIDSCMGPFWIVSKDCGTAELGGKTYPVYYVGYVIRIGKCSEISPWDFDRNRRTDIHDIVTFYAQLKNHEQRDINWDLNGDIVVDIHDLVLKAQNKPNLAPSSLQTKTVLSGGELATTWGRIKGIR